MQRVLSLRQGEWSWLTVILMLPICAHNMGHWVVHALSLGPMHEQNTQVQSTVKYSTGTWISQCEELWIIPAGILLMPASGTRNSNLERCFPRNPPRCPELVSLPLNLVLSQVETASLVAVTVQICPHFRQLTIFRKVTTNVVRV